MIYGHESNRGTVYFGSQWHSKNCPYGRRGLLGEVHHSVVIGVATGMAAPSVAP